MPKKAPRTSHICIDVLCSWVFTQHHASFTKPSWLVVSPLQFLLRNCPVDRVWKAYLCCAF